MCTAAAPAAVEQRSINASETAWNLEDLQADQRAWRIRTTVETTTGPITHTRSFVEMATGLHYWRDGQWNESKDEIELMLGGGAAATKAQYQAYFSPNVNTVGTIQLTTPNGTVLQSHVAALAYTDEATGNSALLGMMQDSIGVLFPPNQVIYANAFAGVRADVRYTFTKGSFEQDIILRENPPNPSEYGMNPATTRLEVWTEFVNAADPEATYSVVVDDMADTWYDFAQMRMGRGVAFRVDSATPQIGAAVAKTWIREDNRAFLVEAVRYPTILQELAALPPLQPT